MRVAIDARHLGQGRGIARNLEQMLAALAAGFPVDEWVAVVPRDREMATPEGVELRRSALPSKALFTSAAFTGFPRIDRLAGGADVAWIPAPAPIACGRKTPYVLTIHDLSFEVAPEDFTSYERRWHRAARPRRLAARAAEVVVDSEATRRALFDADWPLDPSRVTVVHAAPSAAVSGPADRRTGGSDPAGYLLYVGALEPRKGIETLAEAMAEARKAGLRAPLLVVGEGRLASSLEGLPGVRLLGRQSDAELKELYSGALALVMPSTLEGFGLPPVEAATHGVPSVVSDLPIFEETLGKATLSFPVNDSAALAKALVLISGDAKLRAKLGSEAHEAVQKLTWAASAQSLHAVLVEATERR